MIIFKNLRWKNFLSTGDKWTEINLNKISSTLIVGQNGSGKSTMLDALSFALFGKPHRNINKPQLVNSINNRDCIVEVNFTIGKYEYKVIRGIKPQIFEIWRNDSLLNQSSHAKEYQKILEQNLLKLNHKSFHQIVVLGSSSFIPFMQLPAQHRRDVIEDLLDINIFSKMNMLIKEKNSAVKEKLKDLNYDLDIVKNKIESQRKYIRDITQINTDEINDKKEKLQKYRRSSRSYNYLIPNLALLFKKTPKPVQTHLRQPIIKNRSYCQIRLQHHLPLKTSLSLRNSTKRMISVLPVHRLSNQLLSRGRLIVSKPKRSLSRTRWIHYKNKPKR